MIDRLKPKGKRKGNTMKKFDGYMAGVNFGHWLSQYQNQGEEHWSTYITEPDYKRLQEWGIDHVRLPVDYFFFEDVETGEYMPERLAYIDNCLALCKKYGLNLILDLHHAPGYFFGNNGKNTLFTERETQLHFIKIWKDFAVRYKDEGDNLVFELLNELVWESTEPWNKLWHETVKEIRAISPTRIILIGGNEWNSIWQIKNIDVIDDPYVVYNFHCYEPFLFTHQRAGWINATNNYRVPTEYPVSLEKHKSFYGDELPWICQGREYIDKDYLYRVFKEAKDFQEKTGKVLYCGEYGVIYNADLESTVRWHKDMCDIFNEYGIGHAVWSYRGFNHVTDDNNQVKSEELIKIIAAK